MKDMPAEVEVTAMSGGETLKEYSASSGGGRNSAYIESKSGKQYGLTLRYDGRSIFGFAATIAVDGIAVETYTLVPASCATSCIGRLSSDGTRVSKFRWRTIQRTVPSPNQSASSKDLLGNDSKLGSIEIKLYRITSAFCDECPNGEGELEQDNLPVISLPENVAPELSEQTILDPPEPFPGLAEDSSQSGYDWEEKASSIFVFKYRSAESLRQLDVNTNVKRSIARDTPIVRAQPPRATRNASRIAEAKDGEETPARGGSFPSQRTPSSRPDPRPQRSLRDRTPPAAPAQRHSVAPRQQAAPPRSSPTLSRRTTPVASGSGLTPSARPRAILPAGPIPRFAPPIQPARLMNGIRAVSKSVSPIRRLPTPESSASRVPRADKSPTAISETPSRNNRAAPVVEQNEVAQSSAVQSATASLQLAAKAIMDFDEVKVERAGRLEAIREMREEKLLEVRQLEREIFTIEREQGVEDFQEETLQRREVMAREDVGSALAREKRIALAAAVKVEAGVKRAAEQERTLSAGKKVKLEEGERRVPDIDMTDD